ncbi:MAG: hypothetical protein IPM54_02500 [Polyangiaceae bacterium]|nr:hypothetical protein [Polyangiaceae bacterium]
MRKNTSASRALDLPPGMRMYENFISPEAHDRLFALLDNARRERNEGHDDGFEFDDVAEFDTTFGMVLRDIFRRMHKERIFRKALHGPMTLGCTMVGYAVDDYIVRHKDSYLLGGNTIATVSFGSNAVLDFYEDATGRHIPVLVPPRSLYVMAGDVRTIWTHEIKPGMFTWKGCPIARSRRYAILFFEPGPKYDGELLSYP